VRRADAPAAVATLKEGSGGDILMFGSQTLWNGLLAAGLVDELHLMVGAAVLGGGTWPSPGSARSCWTAAVGGSDNVLLSYAVGT
jgi:dihydrofolate reductase